MGLCKKCNKEKGKRKKKCRNDLCQINAEKKRKKEEQERVRILKKFIKQHVKSIVKKLKEKVKETKRKEKEEAKAAKMQVKADKKADKKASKKASRIMQRKYDTAKHVILHKLPEIEKKYNVLFDKEAEKKKKEIWGDDWTQRCVWTGGKKNLSKDHLYPIRGAYGNKRNKKTGWIKEGLRGGDSQWNILMVCKNKNSGFKIFNHKKTHGWKKDVSWQKLTTQEVEQCTEQERDFYLKLLAWRTYTVQRGAKYYWQFTEESNKKLEKLYEEHYKELEKNVDELTIDIV
tara:strand:- start:1286 stop:2149 length:864 start_codon:yes stop_codon:yes gene_type:complete